MPKAERPEEDRDEVLNPAVERGQTECERWQMWGRCVREDTDQNVDHEDKPDFVEKEPYVSGDSTVRAAPGGERSHLSPPPPADAGTTA